MKKYYRLLFNIINVFQAKFKYIINAQSSSNNNSFYISFEKEIQFLCTSSNIIIKF